MRLRATWTIDVTLPKAGYYKVLSDFMPSGGASQFIARPLVTAGYAGDLAADSAHLVPDTVSTKTVDDITANVTYDPPQFAVGLYGHLNFHLTDTATGRPITDLQTYLGAFGHTLIMSEDMVDYVHSHPLDILAMPDDDGGPPVFLIPPGADLEKLRGGPDVTFEGLMPKPGRYRAWTQFRRERQVHTFAFTFNVVEPLSSDVLSPVLVASCCVCLWCPGPRSSHETLTTTVLFDREIVRILDSHCVMCHVENGPSFPLETYEQTWLRRAQDPRGGASLATCRRGPPFRVTASSSTTTA